MHGITRSCQRLPQRNEWQKETLYCFILPFSGGNSGCRNNSNYVDGVVCNADSSNSTTADQSRLMLAALNAGIRGPDPVSTSAVSSCSGSTRRRRCYDPRTHVMMHPLPSAAAAAAVGTGQSNHHVHHHHHQVRQF